eukprot:scaffold190033_cov32-Tisochrysis_lutea.AAC.4
MVPLYPKELTPPVVVFVCVSDASVAPAHNGACALATASPMCELRMRSCALAGTRPSHVQARRPQRPTRPAAGSRWPRLAFTEPTRVFLARMSTPRLSMASVSESARTSVGSPRAVPVPCASTTIISPSAVPARENARRSSFICAPPFGAVRLALRPSCITELDASSGTMHPLAPFIVRGVGQGQDCAANPLPARISVCGRVKNSATASWREHPSTRIRDADMRGQHQADGGHKRETAFIGSLQPLRGPAASSHGNSRASGCVDSWCARVRQHRREVIVGDRQEHGGVRSPQARERHSCECNSLVAHLEQKPLLRVHCSRLGRRHPKRLIVEEVRAANRGQPSGSGESLVCLSVDDPAPEGHLVHSIVASAQEGVECGCPRRRGPAPYQSDDGWCRRLRHKLSLQITPRARAQRCSAIEATVGYRKMSVSDRFGTLAACSKPRVRSGVSSEDRPSVMRGALGAAAAASASSGLIRPRTRNTACRIASTSDRGASMSSGGMEGAEDVCGCLSEDGSW